MANLGAVHLCLDTRGIKYCTGDFLFDIMAPGPRVLVTIKLLFVKMHCGHLEGEGKNDVFSFRF